MTKEAENSAFHDALRKYPNAAEALHYFWNAAIAGTRPAPDAGLVEAATQAERDRCAEIVQMARAGDIDQDWRSVIHNIEGGDTIEQIKEF